MGKDPARPIQGGNANATISVRLGYSGDMERPSNRYRIVTIFGKAGIAAGMADGHSGRTGKPKMLVGRVLRLAGRTRSFSPYGLVPNVLHESRTITGHIR